MVALYDRLRTKKIKITEIPKWGPYLRKQWVDHFANHLSDEDKKSIYLFDNGGFCGFLWHLFSYEKKDCQEGENAKTAFNNHPKKNCYLFYQHSDDIIFLENTSALNAGDLLDEEDIYIVDKGFNWTYIQTHEGTCGPYFSEKS